MRPLRILHVVEATAGGTRRHVREILLHLSDAEFEFDLVCATRRDPDFVEDLELYRQIGVGVQVLDLRDGIGAIHDLRAAWQLRRILRAGAYDLLHFHSAKAGLVGRLAALGLEIPVIYSPHAFAFLRNDRTRNWAWLAERVLSPRTTRLHAVARSEATLAIECGLVKADRVSVIENAVDSGSAARGLPRRRAAEVRVFGFLAELREQKHPLLFVEAAARAVRAGVRARFVMPDQGPLLAAVQRSVQRNALEGVVSFVPSRRSLDHLLSVIDVGVLPSRWEGLPYTLLDAMAHSIPVIASTLPVFREVLGPIDSTLLFAAGDAHALSERLEVWSGVDDARMRSVGEAGRAVVLRRHALPQWKTRMRALYYQVAGRCVPGDVVQLRRRISRTVISASGDFVRHRIRSSSWSDDY